MKTLHFDCFSGISGDMTLAALFDAGVDVEPVQKGLASLGLPITLKVEKIRKGGFAATKVDIEVPHEHNHRHLHHIEEIVQNSQLTTSQRELAMSIFRRLAEAEAAAHGMPVEKVHFHEVGALDSIADIIGVAIALDLLAPEHISSSPVPTGSGMVECAHGLMPIPAPGTAELLKGIPLRSCPIQAELTTPTGAAILSTIVEEWIDSPTMTIEQIGHGAGTMDFEEQPNLLRVFIGSSTAHGGDLLGVENDTIWVLETNVDDIPAEVIGYCYDQLLSAGAVDVFTTPILMKKSRPAVMISVLVHESALIAVEEVLFRETGTFGIRRYQAQRHKLHRETRTVETPWGPIKGKLGWREGEELIFTPEYEECARIAREEKVPLREVYEEVRTSYELEEDIPLPEE